MVEPQEEKVLKEVNLSFNLQYVAGTTAVGTKWSQLRIKITDANGKEIKHNIAYPEDYGSQETLKKISKLLSYYKFVQSNKLEEGLREEILIWIALLLARVA